MATYTAKHVYSMHISSSLHLHQLQCLCSNVTARALTACSPYWLMTTACAMSCTHWSAQGRLPEAAKGIGQQNRTFVECKMKMQSKSGVGACGRE